MAVESRLGPAARPRAERDAAELLAPSLSRREWQVLDELSRGATNRDIAAGLGVCENTVKSHMKAILLKLGARNRTAAAVWFERFRNHRGSWSTDGDVLTGEPPRRPPPTLS